MPLISSVFWRGFRWKNRLDGEIAALGEFARLRPDQARTRMAARLAETIRYFGNRADALPEWREAAKISDPDETLRLWPSLPVLTKRDIVERFPAAGMAARFGLSGRVNSTGGSTGEPTRFYQDTGMIRAGFAATLYARLRMGWRYGMPIIALWGSDRDLGLAAANRKARWMASLRNDHVIGGFRVDEGTVDRFLNLLRRHQPAAVFGYASLLEFLARQVIEQNRQPPPGAVHLAWGGAEMLFASQSEMFRRAFGTPILNWYGSRELSVVAFQPDAASALELIRPDFYLELVNEAGAPVSAGEVGRILVTCTVGRGTPFIRYEIGDLAAADPAGADESGIWKLDRIEGRIAGVMRLPNGTMVNALYWNQVLKEFEEVHQFQVALGADEPGVELRLVGKGFSPEREALARQRMSVVLGTTPVTFVWKESLPLTKQGKLLQVVQR